MLVLAGPGSGKTTVISERVRYLIEEKGIKPEHILTITFTKAAATEMLNRCRKICPQAENAVFGTFHSVFYHILRKSETYQNFSVINEKEKREMMSKIIPAENMTRLQINYACENVLKKISYYKNSQEENIAELEGKEFVSVMRRYITVCHENRKLDFDDMLVLCQKLLKENKSECIKWQNRFRYILVDEFQDINNCQYEIIKILSEKHGNLFAVGDDDQAIYSFRGANPLFMKKFLEDFSDSRKICLENNYRSGKEIVELAGRCIRYNENRFEKQICSKALIKQRIEIMRYDSVFHEINAIAEKIKQEKEENVAVLLRTNAQVELVAEILTRNEIKCVFRERRRCFYENEWVRDILSVLRFVFCGKNRKDLFIFLNKPFRGIPRSLFATECVDFADARQRLTITAENVSCVKEIDKIERCVEMMNGLDPYGAVMYVLGGLKYRSYLEQMAGTDRKIKEQIEDVLQELYLRAKEFCTVPEFLGHVEVYTENFVAEEMKEKEGIPIITYHASKGLEFDGVYLPMLNAGHVPHGKMLEKEQLEEERRMFYVAMTRAKSRLILSWHGKENGEQKSLFLKELEAEEIST